MAFSWCKKLVSVRLSNKITIIRGGTFKGCESLVAVEIPRSVLELDPYAFAYCKELVMVKVYNPFIIESTPRLVFVGCEKLSLSRFPHYYKERSGGGYFFWGTVI